MNDVVIIGAGVVGASVARELSKYDLKVTVLDKENDVSNGTTKANSAIVHGGYDPRENTLMAKYNVRGNEMYESICEELSVPFKRTGALIIGSNEEDKNMLEILLDRGTANGVKGLEIICGDEALKREPNINKNTTCALYAPSVAIVGPWELTIALMENAVVNGVNLELNSKVTGIKKNEDFYEIEVNGKKTIASKYIINAAGLYCDDMHNMVSREKQKVKAVQGEYYILDKRAGNTVSSVIFQCPTTTGKGVLVAPTVHGNLLVGPNAKTVENKDYVSNTLEGLNTVREGALMSVPSINFRDSIRNFSGNRCYLEGISDFVIEEVKDAKGFFDIAGIKSPGLTAAPAIAEDIVKMLENSGLTLNKDANFNPIREKINFISLSAEEKHELIKKDSSYGKMVCRCESVTEGEVIDSIRRPVGATTITGVKKRCGAGLGRCQGGFCMPRIQEILANELGKKLEEIVLDKEGSYILTGQTKN